MLSIELNDLTIVNQQLNSRGVTMQEQINELLIQRLGLDGITPGPQGTVFVLRYESQDAEDRKHLGWKELICELAEQSLTHGLDNVLEAAHIEILKPLS
jgi:hypothetical protein